MRQLKITCDRCGKEITDNPWKVIVRKVDRDSGEYEYNRITVLADFCDECAEKIGFEVLDGRNLLVEVESEQEQGPEPEPEPEPEPIAMEHPECCIGYRPITETAPDAPQATQEPSEDETGINDHEDGEEPETSPVVYDKLGRVHKGGRTKGMVIFTIPRKQKAREMYLAGKTVEEIHEETGVSVARLEKFMKQEFGISGSNRGRKAGSAEPTQPRRDKARALYIEGRSIEEISEKTGLSARAIEVQVENEGLEPMRAENLKEKEEPKPRSVTTSSGVTYWGES